jgi:hypothetical protein
LHFLDKFSKYAEKSNLLKILPVGAEFFHADGRTDMTKLMVPGRNFANALKKVLFPEKNVKNGKLKSKGFKTVHIRKSQLELPDDSACLILYRLILRVAYYYALPDMYFRWKERSSSHRSLPFFVFPHLPFVKGKVTPKQAYVALRVPGV